MVSMVRLAFAASWCCCSVVSATLRGVAPAKSLAALDAQSSWVTRWKTDEQPLCSYLPVESGSKELLGVFVDADNSRSMQFSGDGTGIQTTVHCQGPRPKSCPESPPFGADKVRCAPENCPCVANMSYPMEFPYMGHVMNQLGPKCDAKKQFRVLLLGLGGGALPQYILARCPNGTFVESVEYDPRVISAATQFFGLREEQGISKLVAGEGGAIVADRARQRATYDAVIVDAFGDKQQVPETCRSEGFIKNLKKLVPKKGGLVIQNIQSPLFEKTRPLYEKTFGSGNVQDVNVLFNVEHLIITNVA